MAASPASVPAALTMPFWISYASVIELLKGFRQIPLGLVSMARPVIRGMRRRLRSVEEAFAAPAGSDR